MLSVQEGRIGELLHGAGHRLVEWPCPVAVQLGQLAYGPQHQSDVLGECPDVGPSAARCLEGRDAGSFVAEAQAKIANVKLPAGYYLEWGGQFESLQAASQRLSIVVPLCFAGIFILLYMALGTFGRATAVFLAVPLGLAGGVFTLALTGINFSVSAAVGFICLAGVAVLNGLVVMTAIRERLENDVPLTEAIREGMTEKMRAVIMTGFVPAIGFVPMAIATGTGAEVQKPLATTVIGGLIAATILTLLVLPAIAKVVLGSNWQPGFMKRKSEPAEAPVTE